MNGYSNENESLLDTIRCPRNLGLISSKLPKPQYHQIQRSNSLDSKEMLNQKSNEGKNKNRSIDYVNQSNVIKKYDDRRVRKVASLAIIDEDQGEGHGEEDNIDCSHLGIKRIIPGSQIVKRNDHRMRQPKSKVELKYKKETSGN